CFINYPGLVQHCFIAPAKPYQCSVRPSGHFFILLLLIFEKNTHIAVRKLIGAEDHLFPDHLVDKIKEKRVIRHSGNQGKELLRSKVAAREKRDEAPVQRFNAACNGMINLIGSQSGWSSK